MFIRVASWVWCGVLAVSLPCAAEDAFYSIPLTELELTSGQLPTFPEPVDWRVRQRFRQMSARAALNGAGQAYVTYLPAGISRTGGSVRSPRSGRQPANNQQNRLVIRTPGPREVTGQLFLPQGGQDEWVRLTFRVPAEAATDVARQPFYVDMETHYRQLLERQVPGAAWFRHQVAAARQALEPHRDDVQVPNRGRLNPTRNGSLARTYALFSGGRAVSENLQLDRVLQVGEQGRATVPCDSIEGISIQEIDWDPLIDGLQPELDPLAAMIPADQHVVFFPSFNAAVAMADEARQQGTPILQMAEPRSESARTLERYQTQMGLSLSSVARALGPQLCQSVAMTGSDPYFRTGTDVAVLLESQQPELLAELLLTQLRMSTADMKDVEMLQGAAGPLKYRGARSPDRSICSYIAQLDQAVLVTNSPYQLTRFADLQQGQGATIASLAEFTFFRHRYPLGEKDETALLFLSDATIRRWCSPRWRIGTSRRTRDSAVLAEIQATYLDQLAANTLQSGPVHTDLATGRLGDMRLTPSGVHASQAGSLAFMTPIAEIEMRHVTKSEASAYEQWRNGYQRNWRWAFDPIALRVEIDRNRLAADLTVMPLIWGTDYRTFVDVSRGASIAAGKTDAHPALGQAVLAVNTESSTLQSFSQMGRSMIGGFAPDPLGWLGETVSVFIDDDPLFGELAKISPEEQKDFIQAENWRLPVAIRAEVSNGFKLTAFMAAIRGFIEQSSPGMTVWETLNYRDEPYVKVSPSERGRGRQEHLARSAVYYAASGDALLVTLSEDLLKRSIDRRLSRQADGRQPEEVAGDQHRWLGDSLALHAEQKLLQVAATLGRDTYQRAMQRRAWGNVPILNEWKRRYPDRDPVELHQQIWHTRLICPGGGQYTWNKEWQTMESTIYGRPGAPKEGPVAPPALTEIIQADFGITFEEQGLRARVEMTR